MFLRIFLSIQIVLVHSVNFHIIMQHSNNIWLNFHRKILKIERETVNLRGRFKKKLFCGVHHNSQQNHLKQKNQSAFVKGDVTRGNSGRIFFFSIFQFSVALGSQKTDFRWKKIGQFVIVKLIIIKINKKAPRNTWWIMWKSTVQNFKKIGPVDFELWCTRTSKITSFRKTL